MKDLLARILCSAAHSMWKKDPTLGHYTSETEQHELNLAFHYASELRAWFPGFDCDFDVSKVSCNYERPDIVIHRRNTHALNFLVIEIKREKRRKLVPIDIGQIRERWFENYFQYRFGAAVILEDDKPQFEVQVLSRVEKEREPVVRRYLNMGEPLRCPTPQGEQSTKLLQIVNRIFAARVRDGVLERKMDDVICALYDTAPEEANSSKRMLANNRFRNAE